MLIVMVVPIRILIMTGMNENLPILTFGIQIPLHSMCHSGEGNSNHHIKDLTLAG